jgi:hypothetical protein
MQITARFQTIDRKKEFSEYVGTKDRKQLDGAYYLPDGRGLPMS